MSIARQIKPAGPAKRTHADRASVAAERVSVKPTPFAEKPSRKGIGGRPRKADKLVPVTLRLPPDLVEAYQRHDDWRARMNDALRKAMP